MLSRQTKRWSTAGLIFIGVVVGLIFASNFNWTPSGFASRNRANPPATLNLETPAEVDSGILDLQSTGKAFTAVSKEILPTVVSIATEKVVKTSRGGEMFGPFREFFDRQAPEEEQTVRGLGSGVLVSSEGYILTNHHVVEGADDLQVGLYDNRTYAAKLIGTDPLTEVAVIKIVGADLPVARLGNSERMEVGEWVLAVGNPLGLNSSVTAGIVSAKGRSIGIIRDTGNREEAGSYAIENFIQTDAAINRGNSGGALVNLHGEVIGINTAIASNTGYYQGYGFAIPINLAKKIMNDLIDKGYVTRAWLGIGMNNVTPNMAKYYKLDKRQGVFVQSVVENSPAQKAGIKAADIILSLNGKTVKQSNEIQNTIALMNPGETITLKVLREEGEKTIKVKLGQRDTGKPEAVQSTPDEDLPKLGLEVTNLTDDILNEIEDYRGLDGVLVTRVSQNGAASNEGLRRGHLIQRIGDMEIKSVADYKRAIRKSKKGEVVLFYVLAQNVHYHAFIQMPE